jgi:SNF2 family DNA or RNA helicase
MQAESETIRQNAAKAQKLLLQGQQFLDSYTEAVKEVKEACRACLENAQDEKMRQIAIGELMPNEPAQLQILKSAGLLTLFDVYAVSKKQLSAIKGIGEKGAEEIKDLVRKASAEIRKEASFSLSKDTRNVHTDRMVNAVQTVLVMQEDAKEMQRLLPNVSALLAAGSVLLEKRGFFQNLFVSKEEKEKLQQAESRYESSLPALQSLETLLYRTASVHTEEAWAHYEKEPAAFVQVIETLCPQYAPSFQKDGVLDETLVEQIEKVELAPALLRTSLRPYQKWGVQFIVHQKKVLLGDDMGLGKTLQAIASMVQVSQSGGNQFLVICTASVLLNWEKEIKKFSTLLPYIYHGKERDKVLQTWRQTGGVLLTTFTLAADLAQIQDLALNMLVVDEAHYVKHAKAQRTKSAGALAKKTERILFMTGTALENNVEEMISLISLLDEKLAFSLRHNPLLSRSLQFQKAVAQIYLRRKREEVLKELPQMIESKEWCVLGREEKEAYKAALRSKNYMKIRRVSWDLQDLQKSSKAARLLEIVQQAKEEGRKVIVFSFFLDTLKSICALLQENCAGMLYGGLDVQARQKMTEDFEKAPAGSVLVCQITAGGTGVNMQSASVVILCEPQYKPSDETQAAARAWRMGQTRNVLLYRLLTADTIDERMSKRLEEKQKIFDAYADSSKAAENAQYETEDIKEREFAAMVEEERRKLEEEDSENPSENESVSCLQETENGTESPENFLSEKE